MTQPSLRDQIRQEVARIAAFDDIEKTHAADVLTWIDSGADLFRVKKPDIPPKHLVSYFVLIDPVHKSILLIDHIKAQLWLPPGGHVLPDEHPKDAVKRESLEELRQKAVFLRGNEHPFFVTVTTTVGLTPGHVDVSLWYLLRGDIHQFINFDKTEFNDTEWYTFDEILQSDPVIFDPHLQRFTRKLSQYLA